MRGDAYQILIVLIVNLLLVIIYIAWYLLLKKRQDRKGFLMKAYVMLICPIAGPVFLILSQTFYWLFYKLRADLSDVVFSKERVRSHVRADEEEGRSMVPLEEALAVSDSGSLRNLVMNVVRGDITKSLSAISLALNSEDSETSHYAASVLQDELNSFRFNVQKLYLKIQDKEKDQEIEERADYAVMLLDYMNKVLAQHVFTDMEQTSFVNIMNEAGEILYTEAKDKITGKTYENLCMRLLEIRDYEQCEKWCLRGKEAYPNTLSSFTCLLKLYFSSGRKNEFFSVMDELKHSSVVVDKETLELIRTFS